jgi:hypothetical protein
MKSEQNYQSLLDEARTMYASGNDNKYIILQFAEQGIADEIIDKLILDINTLRKEEKKNAAKKQLVYGLSLIALAILVSIFTYNSESPYRFFLWGAAVSGVVILVKGISGLLF